MSGTIVLHGGAGSDNSFSSVLKIYADRAIEESDAVSAVVAAVSLMEDDNQFNAGTGSVQRIDGTIQMDAAVMTPELLGSVIGIERVKNPVQVARAVMEQSPHLIMTGDGALSFARSLGFEDYDPNTEKAEQLRKKIMEKLFSDDDNKEERFARFLKVQKLKELAHYTTDTVGAVAYIDGIFAGAVSTGGAVPMLRGRVGDSPIPGSGIFVGKNGAVVATGIGEEIIRKSLCFSVYERIGTGDLGVILEEEVAKFGDISVGIIAIDEKQEARRSNRNMATAVSRS